MPDASSPENPPRTDRLEAGTAGPDVRDTAGALRWIVDLMRKYEVPFQLTGGAAARAYGSTRPLADLDFDVPEEALALLYPEVKPYVIWGPARYTGEAWDLDLMTLEYRGQEIDLGGAYRTRIFDRGAGVWRAQRADPATAVELELFGMRVPVMCREDLIDYKRRLAREVDLADVAAMERQGGG